MESAAKRKFFTRDSYQPQYQNVNQYNQKLLIDIATNTDCETPMMLNAWTQTESEDFKIREENNLIDEMQDRLRKLEVMFKAHNLSINETQLNQSNNSGPINYINGKKNQNQINQKGSSKIRQPEKTTYKIISGPAGVEIVEPIEVEYAEDDGAYLDQDLNASNDSNRLEICIPKEECSTNERQQDIASNHQNQNPQHISTYGAPQQYQHNGGKPLENYTSIQEHSALALNVPHVQQQQSQYQHQQQLQQQQPAHTQQLYQTQINGNYHSTQSQQYIVQPNIVGSSGHNSQSQNVIIETHQQTGSISPALSSSLKSNDKIRRKSTARYVGQENTTDPIEMDNEVIASAASSSFIDIKKEYVNHQGSNNSRQSNNVNTNFLPIQVDDIEVSLGPNNTRVSAAVYESIDWGSVTSATRKLLISIFDRETLATHTMTGKPSPAFRGRDLPAKHQLNPRAVHDIIFAVSRKCNVPEKEVRTAITTKCADENKMLKQREKKKRSLQESNKENLIKEGEIN